MAGQYLLGLFQVVATCLSLSQTTLPECLFFGRAVSIGQHHRQGDLALTEIIPHRLAQLLLICRIVKRIIGDLESDAQGHTIFAHGLALGHCSTTHHGPGLGSGGKQLGCLADDHLKIMLPGSLRLAGDQQLLYLPFGYP